MEKLACKKNLYKKKWRYQSKATIKAEEKNKERFTSLLSLKKKIQHECGTRRKYKVLLRLSEDEVEIQDREMTQLKVQLDNRDCTIENLKTVIQAYKNGDTVTRTEFEEMKKTAETLKKEIFDLLDLHTKSDENIAQLKWSKRDVEMKLLG